MAGSSARRPFLVVLVAVVLAVAWAPRAADAWGGGRLFFSKTTRDAAAGGVDPEKAAAALAVTGRTAVPDAADPNAAPVGAASRPSTTGGSAGGRGYGLYGRPEENFPPSYFRRGVHRNEEKLTTTAAATTTTDVPAATATTAAQEEAAPVEGLGGERGAQPYPEDGSGRGRPPWYYTAFRGGRQPEPERERGQELERRDFGMSDTRLYQNGRYYYDVDAGRYGYGRESNPMRTRPEPADEFGSGYGRGGAGGMRGRYGSAAGYRYGNGDSDRERDVFGSGAMENQQNGFPEEAQNGRYIP